MNQLKTHYTIDYPNSEHAARAAAAFNDDGLPHARTDGSRLRVSTPPAAVALSRLLTSLSCRCAAILHRMRRAADPSGPARRRAR